LTRRWLNVRLEVDEMDKMIMALLAVSAVVVLQAAGWILAGILLGVGWILAGTLLGV